MSGLTEGSNIPGKPEAQPAGLVSETDAAKVQGNTPPEALTKDAVAEMVRVEIEKARNQERSQRDKMESRLKKEVEQALAVLKAAGVQDVSDTQVQAIRADVQQRIEAESVPPQTDKPTIPAGEPQSVQVVNEMAKEIVSESGITLEPGDPEVKEIKTDGTARQYLTTLEKALASKKARLENAKGTPAARLPTMGGATPGNPIANITDTSELWRIAMAEMRRK